MLFIKRLTIACDNYCSHRQHACNRRFLRPVAVVAMVETEIHTTEKQCLTIEPRNFPGFYCYCDSLFTYTCRHQLLVHHAASLPQGNTVHSTTTELCMYPLRASAKLPETLS